jgi:hypothetical protein
MTEIDLAAAISAVREEMSRAVAEGAGFDFQFPIDGVELEFKVGVTKTGQAGGTVRFWVLEADASGTRATESSHRVTVALGAPLDRNGQVVRVSKHSTQKP